jgi:NAD(P)-dependent dehydrogenase (short-subunit alcohol dehydrogenase family)
MDGRVAIVTGGTQGLGEAIAGLFADRGAKGLVICGRNAEKGKRVAERLSGRGCSTEYVQADLGVVEDCRKVVAAADARFGGVDTLVNAAALTDRGTIWDTSPELWDRIQAVNVRGPFFLMQETARIMQREKIRGTMVNILSMSSHGGQPFITAYCTSKGALLTLTKNVAFSLEPGKTSNFIPTRQGGFVIHVKARLPVPEDQMKKEFPEYIAGLRQERQYAAFNDWFAKELERADLKMPSGHKNSAN